MLILLPILLQAAAPSPEALDLGVRLARTGGLAALAPTLIEKDLTELAADKSLSEAERARLFTVGRREANEGLDKIMRAMGAAYARRLSVEDLRALVAHGESPTAARQRAAEPAVIMESMSAMGSMDLKKNVAAAFCKDSGKLCERK